MASFARDFLGKQMDSEPPKPETPPKPGEPGAPAAPAAPAAPGAPSPKPKRKPTAPKIEPKTEPPVPALTPEQIAEAAAKGVAQVMRPTIATPPKSELTETEERRFATLTHMEKMYPEKYNGIADRFKTSMLQLQKYAEDWETAHPGQPFDETSEEHTEFFKKHDVDWEDDDYTEAVADIRATAKLEEERKKSDARMSRLERTERLREKAPEIGAHQTAGGSVFWQNTTKELAGVIKEDGKVDTDLLEAEKKKDPIGYTIRVNAANALNVEIAELYKVMNNLADFDETNPAHLAMGEFAARMERDFMRRPDEEQRDDEGRKFLPAAQYWKVPKGNRESYYWTLTAADLAALRATSLARSAEKAVAEEHKKQREYALAMGWTPPAGSETVPPAGAEPEAESPATGGVKPVSPGGAADSRLHASATAGGRGEPDFLSSFHKKQMGQS